MTARGQRLIDENYGLDYYLLKTPVNEVYSHLGMRIKREILLKLAEAVETGKDEKLAAKFEEWSVLHLLLIHFLPLGFNEADTFKCSSIVIY